MATIHVLSLALMLLCGMCSTLAARRYIAIPIDGVDIIELNAISPPTPRIPRQTETYVPIAITGIQNEEILDNPRPERSANVFDYVDFGGHTGANGAYSWYADYPSHR